MPSFAMTLPYMRTSPIHVPRRDLVLGRADSLYLRVTVVDSDNPCAQALEMSGGIGGPVLQMLVWPDHHYRNSWDYGRWNWAQCPGQVCCGSVYRRCVRRTGGVRHRLPDGDHVELAAAVRLRHPARLRRRRQH